MKLHQLRFEDSAQEKRYQTSLEGNLIIQMRLGLLAPAILYLVISFLDSYILPTSSYSAVSTIHLIESVFLLSLVLSFLYFRRLQYHKIMVTVGVMVAWTCHLLVIEMTGDPIYLGEGYLMVIWVWLVSRLNVRQSFWVMVFFLIEFIVYFDLSGPPFQTLTGQLFFLLAAGIFGVLASTLLDYHRRKHFVAMEKNQLMEAQFLQAQKMEAIGTLVGGVAHEFNNMLAGITGSVFLAKGDVKDCPKALERLNTIERISFRAAEMIQHMLTFARKDMVKMVPVSLNSMIEETIRFVGPSLPASIVLETDDGKDEFLVRGDTSLLQHLLVNLINNARDAVEEAGAPNILIRMRRFNAGKDWLARHQGLGSEAFVCLSVRDNGIGFDADKKARIFEPFYTTKEVGKGTGLGLSMVYGAVQTHHGVIEVDSAEGAGAEFGIYLPLLKDLPSSPASQPAKTPLFGHGETILLVDDDRHLLDTSQQVLERLGFKVLLAMDGNEAVEQVRRHDRIVLTVMDLVMPGMGGVEAMQCIKRFCPSMKVVFVSGYDVDETLKRNLDESGEASLAKPYHVDDLARKIRLLLAHHDPASG